MWEKGKNYDTPRVVCLNPEPRPKTGLKRQDAAAASMADPG
jgi:hypothetical protein